MFTELVSLCNFQMKVEKSHHPNEESWSANTLKYFEPITIESRMLHCLSVYLVIYWLPCILAISRLKLKYLKFLMEDVIQASAADLLGV